MQAVLYIEITSNIHYFYEKPSLAYIRQYFPQVMQYDIDNHSDTTLIGYAIQLLAEASQVLIIIEARESQTQVLLPLFEKIIANQHKYLVIYNGNNAVAERYISLLADEQVRKQVPDKEIQTIIHTFFGNAET